MVLPAIEEERFGDRLQLHGDGNVRDRTVVDNLIERNIVNEYGLTFECE